MSTTSLHYGPSSVQNELARCLTASPAWPTREQTSRWDSPEPERAASSTGGRRSVKVDQCPSRTEAGNVGWTSGTPDDVPGRWMECRRRRMAPRGVGPRRRPNSSLDHRAWYGGSAVRAIGCADEYAQRPQNSREWIDSGFSGDPRSLRSTRQPRVHGWRATDPSNAACRYLLLRSL